jgi:phenylalanyl-tRNA synthetase alpha chain
LFDNLKQIPADRKKEFGKILNELKQTAETKFAELNDRLQSGDEVKTDVDLTLPPIPNNKIGNLHPLTLTKNRIIEIFERLGFNVADGPEIEDDWHNFSALNFPANHPLGRCKTLSSSRKKIKKVVTFYCGHTHQTFRSDYFKNKNHR